MDELKMTQEEFEILDRILSGRLHKRERLEVIALIDKEGFSRRPELVPLDENTVFNWFRSTFKYDLKSGFGVNKRTKFFKDKSKEFYRAFSAQPASQGLPFPGFHDDDFFETLKHYSGGLINDSNGTAVANAVAERANIVLEMKLRLAKKAEDYLSASSVNAELRSALEECIRVMIDNDEYGWSDDAIKQAEQALNSIKAGKDTK